jgi:signal transduction histidine kinase
MRIRGRFALLVATAAVLPLVIFGIVAVGSLRTGTRQSVTAGNVLAASRAAEQIEQYLMHAIATLQALAADLQGTAFAAWQQERILRNYVLAFPMFRELALFDGSGRPVAMSRLVPTTLAVPPADRFDARGVALSPITIDDDLLPRATVSVQVTPGLVQGGAVVAELRLEEMWRLVDRLRVGTLGFALVVDREGRLIAHGNPDEKAEVARGGNLRQHPLSRRNAGWPEAPTAGEYLTAAGERVLGVAAPIPAVSWTLILEQPTRDAYAVLFRLERQLIALIVVALLITIIVGYYWGRSFIRPITALVDGTEALAQGKLDTRVRIERNDEFATLGNAFNTMADRLRRLQDEARRQERQAMFGKIAAGLVHDLSHPFKNLGNNCRLILKMYDDAEYREMFRRTVERELQMIRRLFDDLRNLAHPIPLERFPIDLGRTVGEAVDSLRSSAHTAGVTLRYDPPAGPVSIEGDVFALARVYRNIIMNALQATAPGGEVAVSVRPDDGRARIVVQDTGCGIAPERLPAIFDDFVTTKRRGLGLGLPLAKKTVEQLGGTISVTSAVGFGTTVTVEFPTSVEQPLQPAPL